MQDMIRSCIDEEYGLFIGGQWVKAENGATFSETCPSTGEELCRCAEASVNDVDKAVRAAWAAFETYKKTSTKERSRMLHKIADAVETNKERLALAECLDTGKLLAEAMGDVGFAIDFFHYCGGAILSYEGSTTMTNDTTMQMIVREPIGVAGLIIPWNVPFIIEAWKLGPALATGCTVVMKPSSQATIGTMEFLKIVQDIIPAGVLNVVTGAGSRCGQYLMDHPDLSKLSFTGSTEIGKAVGLAAAEKIIPCTLELGGKSVNIVFPDADRNKVRSSLKEYLNNCAQVCSAGSRLFIHESIYDEIVDMCAELYGGIKVGLPWEEGSQMGALTYKKHFEDVLDYVQSGIDQGARLACGGYRLTKNGLDKGLFMEPTLLADVTNDMKVAQEEIFGPVLVAIKFKDEEDVLRMANDSKYGLSGAVFTRDINRAFRIARGVETGRMWINAYGDISTYAAIFGGYKQSGIGREGHWRTFDHYTQMKSIVVNLAE